MKTLHRTCWCVLLLWLAVATAQAASLKAVRKQVEASMLVTGRVTITQEGTVRDWTIDLREKLPEAVANLVDAAVPGWRFEPILVDGRPAHGSARMSLLVAAQRLDEERFGLSIRDGYFGREAVGLAANIHGGERRSEVDQAPPEDQVALIRGRPPTYPKAALVAGVAGTVYIALRIGRSGQVEEAAVEQVNLRVLGTEGDMERMRAALTKPALAAARRWEFRPPTRGESAGAEFWEVRMPVDYAIGGSRTAYGEWEAYLPGPRMLVPWRVEGLDSDVSPDTLVAGELRQMGMGLKLLSPIEGG